RSHVTMLYFFFSSRRRHTRCYRDWSSDVCSSDLRLAAQPRAFCELDIAHPPQLPQPSRRKVAQIASRAAGGVRGKFEFIFEQIRSEERRVGKEWRVRWERQTV